jgi:hypothetical protein
MSASVPVCCFSCGNQACVNRVTANLRCRCGSTDVDLFDGSPEQLQALAMAKIARTSFLDFMREGASTPVGSEIKGWNVYEGPMPGPNPWGSPATAGAPCPACHGNKFDLQDGGPCRECGGSGVMTPTTSVSPAPLVARHPEPTTQTKIPFMARRRVTAAPTVEDVLRATTPDYSDRGGKRPPKGDGTPFSWDDTGTHYPRADSMSPATRYRQERDYSQTPPGHFAMPGAACPNCGADPTHLVKDHKENAWWHCPNCGPLANIDQHPQIDPYAPEEGFTPNSGGFKEGKTATYEGQDRGSLLRMVATTAQANSGLSPREVVFLARAAVSRYLEQS